MAQINKPSEYFNTKLYTGNGSTQSITGVGFQPDMCWWKMRSGVEDHALGDAVRGATKIVKPNATSAEATSSSYFTSFDSDGFTLGSDSKTNANSSTYASWNWKANGAGVSNTDGDIASTVSANTTSGFSIVSYAGTGSNATVGHGLGVAPKMIIFKNRNTATDWDVYIEPVGAGKRLYLNNTSAEAVATNYMNDTAPTNTLFSVGVADNTNKSGSPQIAYCFAEKKGFSKFGSYTGNGSADGTFVYTGFKPAFVLFKRAIGGTDSWFINDTARATYNPSQQYMRPNETSAEGTSSAHQIDILSNGFKIRSSDTAYNTLNNTYIYMAFAEEPLVGTNGIPATAR
jgi:hypothetical protein